MGQVWSGRGTDVPLGVVASPWTPTPHSPMKEIPVERHSDSRPDEGKRDEHADEAVDVVDLRDANRQAESPESTVNTYDPSDYICYVTMDRKFGHAPANGLMGHRLRSGYANASPRTRLRSRAARTRGLERLPSDNADDRRNGSLMTEPAH
jgi:hypothetical protein